MKLERIPAPTGGVNSDAGPDYLQADEATALENLLTGSRGKVYSRGPLAKCIGTVTQAPLKWTYPVWCFRGGILVGNGSAIWYYDTYGDASPTSLAGVTSIAFQSRGVRYGDYMYGVSNNATKQMLRWDGTSSGFTAMTPAPCDFEDLTVHAERLFVLGGTKPGTTTPELATSIWFTNPGADPSLAASWLDPVSGLTNQIVVPDAVPRRFARCGRWLAILGDQINLLTGDGASNFALRNLSRSTAYRRGQGVVEIDDGFYFPSYDGFYFCDGSSLTNVASGRAAESFQALTDGVTAASLPGNYVVVASPEFLTDEGRAFAWMLHTPTRSWSKLTTALIDEDADESLATVHRDDFGVLFSNGVDTFLFASSDPTVSPTVTSKQSFTGDVADDNTVLATVHGDDFDTGSVYSPIPHRWVSRLLKLAGPAQTAHVKRVMLDLLHTHTEGTGYVADVGLHVAVKSPDGTVLAETDVDSLVRAGGGADTPPPQPRQRLSLDVNGSADSIYVEVTNAQTLNAAVRDCEIYDAWVEFEPAQERGTI